ncbi:hypothetical protein KP509_01G117600 [Ceratopteris richardii]|uniref:Bidirectional sugar transporter SWEET n=1 Tax=Ceratopteris richardii TaxID=49495 RepID=A0A8T2VQC2_CERRI|nr:hypothetical protein KP509_01G117600 [Ceratopteris richardii]
MWTGNITGILLYASPAPIFLRIIRRKSTESFSGVIYAVSALSTLQWTYFALLRGKKARPLASLTAIGFSLQVAFNCIYLRFASRSQRRLQILLLFVAATFFIFMATLTSLLLNGTKRAVAVGIICDSISVCYSASPLVIMRRVIKFKSTEFLPFYLPLFFFLSGILWTIFALLTHDLFIAIPNCVNMLLGGLQLIIHLYFNFRRLISASQTTHLVRIIVVNGKTVLSDGYPQTETISSSANAVDQEIGTVNGQTALGDGCPQKDAPSSALNVVDQSSEEYMTVNAVNGKSDVPVHAVHQKNGVTVLEHQQKQPKDDVCPPS